MTQHPEGRKLLCEALYLYGVMLLLLELIMPGPVRERIIVFYYRHHGQMTIPTIQDAVKMFRTTGYSELKRPLNYPEEFFARSPI